MIALIAVALSSLLVAAQVCDRPEANSPCDEGRGRAGNAMLQTDVGATVQQVPGDSRDALLLETDVVAKSKSKAAPLVGKVNALVGDVSKLDTEVAGLEKAVGISKTGPDDAAPMTALTPSATPPPTLTPTVLAEPEGAPESFEEPGTEDAMSMLDAPPEEDSVMDDAESLSLRQDHADRTDFHSHRASAQNVGGGHQRQYPTATYPQTLQQPMSLMKKASTKAPADSLKSKVAELEGRVSDISSRIVTLENEVLGHAVSSLLELDSTTKLSETPMVAAALSNKIISQQQAKEAAGSGNSGLYMNALKSRTLRMEETVDDLKTRAHTLTQEVLR